MPVTDNILDQDQDQDIGRIPPQAVDMEEAVLGSMLMEMEAVHTVAQLLSADDFYRPAHRHIYSAIMRLYQDNRPIEVSLVENELRDMDLAKEVGGYDVINELFRSVPSSASVEYYAMVVKEKSQARQAIIAFGAMIKKAYEPGADIYQILEDSEKFVYESLTGETANNMQPLDHIMRDSLEYLLSIQGRDGGIIGIPSGLDFDQITSGWQPGKLYTIAGRPGMGKTAMMLHSLKAICQHGHKAGVISLEMGRRSLGTRLILAEAGVDNQRAMQGKLNEDEMNRVNDAAVSMMNLGMVIDDTSMLTPSLLRVKARMMKQVHKIDALAVDYIQLMHAEGKQSREQEVADISRTCKLLAKELDIPVIALAQLSREPDKRQGWKTRPQLADLRESGAIEQDSDVVIFLYRPEYYKIDTYPDGPHSGQSTEGVTEIIIDKHREGPTGIKMIYFNKQSMRFENLSRTKSQLPHHNPYDQPDWLED